MINFIKEEPLFTAIIILVLITIFKYAYSYYHNRKMVKLYKKFFDDFYAIGKWEWMDQRSNSLKYNKAKRVAYKEMRLTVERIGDVLYFQEGHMFGDIYKTANIKAFDLFLKKEKLLKQ